MGGQRDVGGGGGGGLLNYILQEWEIWLKWGKNVDGGFLKSSDAQTVEIALLLHHKSRGQDYKEKHKLNYILQEWEIWLKWGKNVDGGFLKSSDAQTVEIALLLHHKSRGQD